MCVIPWPAGESGDPGAIAWADRAGPLRRSQEEEGCTEDTVLHLLLIFGGMDTQGEIYQDCVVSLIE